MAYQQKDMTGTLFNNDRRTRDSQPDRRGSALIDGVEYWVSGWEKEGQKGPFMSLSFERKDAPRRAPEKPTQQAPRSAGHGRSDMDDDIPF